MKFLDLTLNSAVENLALDEALLDAAEAADGTDSEVLRLWESPETMVVLGSSSRIADEVNVDICRQCGVQILRRASGGATIVTGPGCLMYAVVLSYELRPQLKSIDAAHRFVLETIAHSLRSLNLNVSRAGISDLVLGDKKFSGNSLRCKRKHLLYHGTLLYDFPLAQIGELLKMPQRQPTYREHRSHDEFITNLPLDVATLRRALTNAFSAQPQTHLWPRDRTLQLVAEKYNRAEWNARL